MSQKQQHRSKFRVEFCGQFDTPALHRVAAGNFCSSASADEGMARLEAQQEVSSSKPNNSHRRREIENQGLLHSLVFHPNGRLLCVVGENDVLGLYDIHLDPRRHYKHHHRPIQLYNFVDTGISSLSFLSHSNFDRNSSSSSGGASFFSDEVIFYTPRHCEDTHLYAFSLEYGKYLAQYHAVTDTEDNSSHNEQSGGNTTSSSCCNCSKKSTKASFSSRVIDPVGGGESCYSSEVTSHPRSNILATSYASSSQRKRSSVLFWDPNIPKPIMQIPNAYKCSFYTDAGGNTGVAFAVEKISNSKADHQGGDEIQFRDWRMLTRGAVQTLPLSKFFPTPEYYNPPSSSKSTTVLMEGDYATTAVTSRIFPPKVGHVEIIPTPSLSSSSSLEVLVTELHTSLATICHCHLSASAVVDSENCKYEFLDVGDAGKILGDFHPSSFQGSSSVGEQGENSSSSNNFLLPRSTICCPAIFAPPPNSSVVSTLSLFPHGPCQASPSQNKNKNAFFKSESMIKTEKEADDEAESSEIANKDEAGKANYNFCILQGTYKGNIFMFEQRQEERPQPDVASSNSATTTVFQSSTTNTMASSSSSSGQAGQASSSSSRSSWVLQNLLQGRAQHRGGPICCLKANPRNNMVVSASAWTSWWVIEPAL